MEDGERGSSDTADRRGHGVKGRSGPPGNGNARKHGLHSMRRTLNDLGTRRIDNRTVVARAMSAWRSELIVDLGGAENITTQELALVEEAVKTKLLLDSIDAWLLGQPSLIDKRKRSVIPVVRDRQALVSTLRGLLGDLGLKRRVKSEPSLNDYIATKTHSGGQC